MPKKPNPRLSTWISILSGMGLLLASWLLYVHIRLYTDASYEPICAVSEGWSCSRVAASRWSVVGELPVAVWGILGYVGMGLMALIDRSRGNEPGYAGTMAALGWSFAAVSGVLAFISLTRIDSVCLVCTGTYVVNAWLAVLATSNARRRGRLVDLWIEELRSFFSPAWEGAFTVVVVCSVLAALWMSYPRYWLAAAWLEGPRLSSGLDERGDPWLGGDHAKVTIHEYLDFECPGCRTAHLKLRRFIDGEDGIRLVRHDMSRAECRDDLGKDPHWDACGVMRGAHCAARQGHYWEFNDAVLASPKPLVSKERVDYELRIAEQIGLGIETFEACLTSPETVAAVKEKNGRAKTRGVKFTPTYFIGERKASLEDIFEQVTESESR